MRELAEASSQVLLTTRLYWYGNGRERTWLTHTIILLITIIIYRLQTDCGWNVPLQKNAISQKHMLQNFARWFIQYVYISCVIICPIAIAYSMGQIMKLVCVCQSVSVSVHLRVLSWLHFLIDFHQNWQRRKNHHETYSSGWLTINFLPRHITTVARTGRRRCKQTSSDEDLW